MLRRLFIVLQYLGSIPFLIFLFFWLFGSERFWYGEERMIMFVLSLIPYGLIILGKWIIYGTFNIFKIGQDIKPKKGERENKDDEWKTEWKN